MHKQGSRLLATQAEGLHRRAYAREAGMVIVVEDDQGAGTQRWSPGFHLRDRVITIVRAVDVEEVDCDSGGGPEDPGAVTCTTRLRTSGATSRR